MALLHLEPLPRKVNKGDLLRLLVTTGGLDRRQVGRIELRGRQAVVEVPDGWEPRLVKALDGARLGERRLRAWTDHRSAPKAATGDEDHFQRLSRLLDVEGRSEAQQLMRRIRKLSPEEAQRSGNTVLNLAVADEDTGLGGRHLVELRPRKGETLPWTRLGVGSPVVLSPDVAKTKDGHRGVVCQRGDESIQVALDKLADDLGDHDAWRIDLSHDDAADKRQQAALERARLARADRFAQLRDVLLGKRKPEFGVEREPGILDTGLNEAQRAAVQFGLSARDVALIHGPPGTGKTTAIVELIRQEVRRGRKVLACAPSNLGVDNIFERLLAVRERVVRIGHPARVLPELRRATLDLLVEKHRDVRLARKLAKQAMTLFRQADRQTRARPAPGEKRQLRGDARSLLADARRLEAQAVENVLDSAQIVCSTTTALDSELLGDRHFDLVVIDEACQSTEPGCWIPLLRCDRVVLAGDHCQLPPTVVSREAAAEGFATSLFERMMQLHGKSISHLLSVQYRMHRSIMDFSSREFYDGQLQADGSVESHRLVDLPDVEAGPLTETPVEFIDTAGAGFDEQREPDGESRLNPREAELVCRKVHALLESGLPASSIAVVSPYGAQVRLLREQLEVEGLEIDSVDGFQGREKEAVVISTVRSNATGEIGFLADVRRMNVAMTRARRKLLLIGDSATLANNPFYQRMLDYFEQIGAYRTVWEEDA